jgi:hypothetical protein
MKRCPQCNSIYQDDSLTFCLQDGTQLRFDAEAATLKFNTQVAPQVKVKLRGKNPITLTLESQNPHVEMYFEITNLSDLQLTLDRLIIKVWFTQPTFVGAILERYKIPPREIVSDIYYWQALTSGQKAQIESCQSSNGTIYIYLTAYFQSEIGIVEVENIIERACS